jgi:DNA-binding phage protein
MTTRHAEEMMARFAEPFAKALAVFVREVGLPTGANGGQAEQSHPDEQGAGFVDVDDDVAAEAVAGRIRRLMRQRRMTQATIAKKAGVSVGVVARALRDPDCAKLATLRKVALALDARFIDLL